MMSVSMHHKKLEPMEVNANNYTDLGSCSLQFCTADGSGNNVTLFFRSVKLLRHLAADIDRAAIALGVPDAPEYEVIERDDNIFIRRSDGMIAPFCSLTSAHEAAEIINAGTKDDFLVWNSPNTGPNLA